LQTNPVAARTTADAAGGLRCSAIKQGHAMNASLLVATIFLLAAAVYAQYRIPFHTVVSRVALLRSVLALVGAAFGYVVAARSGLQDGAAVLTFFAGFGVVHVPAAAILFFKRARQEGRS
jgi:hypothetical protein